MTRDELIDLKHRGPGSGWKVDSSYRTTHTHKCQPYPFVSTGTGRVSFGCVSVFTMEKVEGAAEKCHSVVLACTGDEFWIWCGDAFLEGRIKKGLNWSSRVDAAAEFVAPSRRSVAKDAMAAMHDCTPENSGCNFWSVWAKGTPCKHVNTLLQSLTEAQLRATMDDLAQTHAGYVGGSAPAAEIESTDSVLAELAFRVPILLEGERGSGKTHEAFAFAKASGHTVVLLQGHESLEAIDMLGYQVHTTAFGPAWRDGKISEAFREARKRKVVLIVDELLRIPQRQLSVFLGALTPFDDTYRLNTGRIVEVIDGIGREECLECPTENLCVIATTNIGAEYAVDALDPALAERFHIVRKDTSRDDVLRVIGGLARERGFSAGLAEKMAIFLDKMKELLKQNFVVRAPTTRTLARALMLARNEKDVAAWLSKSALTWVGRDTDGKPVLEQVESVDKVINTIFTKAR